MIMVPNMETADTSIVSVAPCKRIHCQIYRLKFFIVFYQLKTELVHRCFVLDFECV